MKNHRCFVGRCGKITGIDWGYKELRSQLLHDGITLFLWHILGAQPDDIFRISRNWHVFWWEVRLWSVFQKFFIQKRREEKPSANHLGRKMRNSTSKTPNTMDGSNREVGISHLLPQGKSTREVDGNFTIQKKKSTLLPRTINIASEIWWLEEDPFLLGWSLLSKRASC